MKTKLLTLYINSTKYVFPIEPTLIAMIIALLML